MKKIGYILALVVVLGMTSVMAQISISEPLDVYNLGDRLYITVDGLIGSESGNLNINLVCGNTTTGLVKIPGRAFSLDKAQSYSVPYKILNNQDLELEDLSQILGECKVVASLGSSMASTKSFIVSDNIVVAVSLDKMNYNPGETVRVDIEAFKINGVPLEGFIEASNASDFSKAVEEGIVTEIFSIPETAEAGNYILGIRAYDTGKDGVLNEGITSVSYTVNQIASSIVMSLSNIEVVPGEEFTIGTDVFDQAGIEMDGTVSLQIISPNDGVIETSVPNNDFIPIDFPFNASVGTWQIIAYFNELSEVREFEMLGVQEVEFDFEDSVLTVTNIGNTLYNKSLEVKIGEDILDLDLNIKVDEVRKFSINAPNGEYDVVIADGENSITRNVLLTGKAISVNDLKSVGIFKGYSVVWIFLIIVLGGIGAIFFLRYRKTKTVGNDGVIHAYSDEKKGGIFGGVTKHFGKAKDSVSSKVPANIKSQVNNSLNFTNKSPTVQGLDSGSYSHEDKTMVDFTKKSSMSAESTLVLKGKKYVSSIVSLSVKNHGDLSDIAKEAVKKSVAGAQKKKGLIDWRGDYVFVVFSPLITKTYKNETLAVNEGMEILNSLNEYNKKFKDKIQFNIGVHAGELITSKEGGKLKYTSIGNAISLAKRISDSNSKKLIVSDDIRKKLMRDLKVIKSKEIGDNQTYEVTEVKNKAEDAAKLKDLLKRTS